MKAIYPIINNVTKKLKKSYAIIEGKTRKIKKAYIISNGVTKIAWQSVVEAGSITFTSSTNWVVPDGIKKIDIFCCGGGGGAGGSVETVSVQGVAYVNYYYYGSCGAGGYTNTLLSYSVTPGQTLQITVGAGGVAGLYYFKQDEDGSISQLGTTTSTSSVTNGGAGGMSKVTLNGVDIITAAGGNGGIKNINSNYVNGVNGGSGSSSSGCRAYAYTGGLNPQADYVYFPGNEGSDGGNGQRSGYNNLLNYTSYVENAYGTAGTGQGRTTREFGESTGKLYSTAGGNINNNTPNSGNGGGVQFNPHNGAAGAVVIRWATQEI